MATAPFQLEVCNTNSNLPKERARIVPLTCNFASLPNQTQAVSLMYLQQQQQVTAIQSVFIDNSANSFTLSLLINGSEQTIIAQPNTQGYYPVLVAAVFGFTISSVGSSATSKLWLLNFPAPAGVWGPNFSIPNPLPVLNESAELVTYSGDIVRPRFVGNRTASVNIPAGAALQNYTLLTPPAYFYVTQIILWVHPAMTCSVVGGGNLNLKEGTLGNQIWSTVLYFPGSTTINSAITGNTPPVSLFYNSQSSGTPLILQWIPPGGTGVTANGSIEFQVCYGLTAQTF